MNTLAVITMNRKNVWKWYNEYNISDILISETKAELHLHMYMYSVHSFWNARMDYTYPCRFQTYSTQEWDQQV